MTLQPNFLPVGSVVSYNCGSEQFPDWQPTTLDWQDLQWLSQTPIEFNAVHEGIPLTPEILTEWCSSEKVQFIKCKENSAGNVWMPFIDNIGLKELTFVEYKDKGFEYRDMDLHLHQLQHLYSALTQTVLPITIK